MMIMGKAEVAEGGGFFIFHLNLHLYEVIYLLVFTTIKSIRAISI